MRSRVQLCSKPCIHPRLCTCQALYSGKMGRHTLRPPSSPQPKFKYPQCLSGINPCRAHQGTSGGRQRLDPRSCGRHHGPVGSTERASRPCRDCGRGGRASGRPPLRQPAGSCEESHCDDCEAASCRRSLQCLRKGGPPAPVLALKCYGLSSRA